MRLAWRNAGTAVPAAKVGEGMVPTRQHTDADQVICIRKGPIVISSGNRLSQLDIGTGTYSVGSSQCHCTEVSAIGDRRAALVICHGRRAVLSPLSKDSP